MTKTMFEAIQDLSKSMRKYKVVSVEMVQAGEDFIAAWRDAETSNTVNFKITKRAKRNENAQ